jgi:acetyl esterase/lipase
MINVKKINILFYLSIFTFNNVQSQDKFNLKFTANDRFEITDKIWSQTIGDANVCLWNDDKLSAFTITIDDNNEQDIPFWQELQQKYNFPYTWFVITEADKKYNVKNWKLFNELIQQGNAVQGHDDRNWYENPKRGERNTSVKKYRKRLQATIDKVESNIQNQKCITYAYPWGEGNDIEVSKKFIAIRDVIGWPNQANQINFEHVNSVSNRHIYGDKTSRDKYFSAILTKSDTIEGVNYYRGWLSTHFHHITSDKVHQKTEEFLQYIKEREDKLWIATFPHVVKYAQEYATHSLKTDSISDTAISFTLTDEMLDEIYDYPLTVKIRLPNNWTLLTATQNGESIENRIINYNQNKYALVKAVPDKGKVILNGIIDLNVSKTTINSRLELTTLTDYFHIPKTISSEAQELLKNKTRLIREGGTHFPKGNTSRSKWKALQNFVDDLVLNGLEPIKEYYKPSIDTIQIGGVRAINIKPKDYKKSDKIIFYIHGGAYVVLHADVTLASMLPLAEATGLRIVAIDYTLAPEAKFEQITDEVIQFYKGLLEEYDAKNIAVYGDSAGGALSAGSILKMQDQNIELPAVLVLWSPWADIDQVGDTYFTLADNDPNLVNRDFLENAALAYAPKSEFKNPYVSPVYGDFSKGFPPTLIQVGSKEIFLSNAIRMYRALDDANKDVKLDVYEGMWHVWQGHYLLPESKKAVNNTKKFMFKHLKIQD